MRWFGGGLRIVRAICRPVSVTLMRALSSSSRPHQKHVPTGVTPPDRSVLVCASGVSEAIGRGMGPLHDGKSSEVYALSYAS